MIDYFTFSTKDAKQYGVDGAIMLHHIRYWVAKNEANETNFHDGQYWTYNSTTAFAKLFPFYSARKIGRILSKLEEESAIISGNFNGKRYDRTKWFTLVNAITENGMLHLTKTVNAITESVEPIPKYNQSTTQITTKKGIELPFEGELFAEAWQIWKQYKKLEKNFRFKSSISEQASLINLQKISNNNEQDAITIIHTSVAQGWSGFYADKKAKGKKEFDNAKYSDYLDTL
mgnify:FL=1